MDLATDLVDADRVSRWLEYEEFDARVFRGDSIIDTDYFDWMAAHMNLHMKLPIPGWERSSHSSWKEPSGDFFQTGYHELKWSDALMLASLRGYGPITTLRNQDAEAIDFKLGKEILQFDTKTQRPPLSSNGSHRIQFNEHQEWGAYAMKGLNDGSRMYLLALHSPFSGEKLFVPVLSKMGNEPLLPLSVRYPEMFSQEGAFDIMECVFHPEEFDERRSFFERPYERASQIRDLSPADLEMVLEQIAPEHCVRDFLPQLEARMDRISGVSLDLDPYSQEIASRVQFSGSSAVIKIIRDSTHAQREYSLLQAAQSDDYLQHFVPRLLIPELFSYHGKNMLVMEDVSSKHVEIPEFVYEHFSRTDELTPGLDLSIESPRDFKVYLAALFHSRGEVLKAKLPDCLFAPSYLSFDFVRERYPDSTFTESEGSRL